MNAILSLILLLNYDAFSDFIYVSREVLIVSYVIGTIIDLIILLRRKNALNNREKKACGILTLIFVSVIGGILTLCIPYNELGVRTVAWRPLTQREKNNKKFIYAWLLKEKILTQAEYELKLKEIGCSFSDKNVY